MKKVNSAEEYIDSFSGDVKLRLKKVRSIIKKLAPAAEESISYGMPAYKTGGKPLVYFAGYEQHIGFYATPTGHKAFEKELSKFKQGKGSVQFPLTEPLPEPLIEKIVKFRVKENNEMIAKKTKLKNGK